MLSSRPGSADAAEDVDDVKTMVVVKTPLCMELLRPVDVDPKLVGG